jgi:4'-phosphopantetheinyl transferase
VIPIESLPADTVRLRWLSTAAADPARIGRWRTMLDEDERARADRFRFAADRDTFTAAHALMRWMLSAATGMPFNLLHYVTGPHGKPALPAGGLHFNLSHTRGFVACAIARDEIGIDVEASDRPADLAIADQYFAPREALAVRSAAPARQTCVFFRLWTLKEAFIKATGEGLSRPLASFSFTLDPVRISFHPGRDDIPRPDDPAAWQFIEVCPAQNRKLALAIRRAGAQPLRLDARAARPEELGCQRTCE